MAAALVLVAIAAAAVGLAFTFRLQGTPDYREALVAQHRPLSLDPYIGSDDRATHDVGGLLYRRLIRLDDQAAPAPDLARLSGVSADGYTYGLSLIPGQRWSDGSPITALDVAATLSFVEAPGLADPAVTAAWRGIRATIQPGETVQFTLPSPRASFLTSLAELPILPLGSLDPAGIASLPGRASAAMATSGSYRVLSNEAGALELEANGYAPATPGLNRIEFRLFPDFDSANRSLTAGEVDAVTGVTPGQQARLARSRAQLHRLTTYRFVDVLFNERVPALSDPTVRHAMAVAVDRPGLVARTLGGAGEPQARAIPAGVRWVTGGDPPPADVASAAAQLTAAGWIPGPSGLRARGGQVLAFALSTSDSAPLPDVARDLVQQYARLGIGLQVRVSPSITFTTSVLVPHAFDLALADWDSGPDPDISTYWRSNATPPSGFNVSGGPSNPFLDQALDSLATLTDLHARQTAAAQVDAQIADSAPAMFLYAPADGVAIRDTITSTPIPGVGGGAARFAAIASWSNGRAPGHARDLGELVLLATGVVVVVASVLFTGTRLASRVLPPDRGSAVERAAIAAFLDVLQVVVVMQLLGALHLLWPLAVLVVHVLIAAVVVARVPPPPCPDVDPPLPSRGWLAVILASIPFAALALVRGVSAASGEFETRRYHLANVAQWLQAHETWTLPFAAPGSAGTANAPGNADLVSLWAILPTHGDELAYVINVGFALVCVFAGAMIVRQLGVAPWKGALAALIVVTAPVCLLSQERSMLPDLAATAGLLMATGFLLRRREDPASWVWPLLSGAGLGLAVGSELPAVLPAIAVGVWGVLAIPRDRGRAGALLAGGALALCGFWFLRDWVMSGNPIYPVPVVLGGHVLLPGGPDLLAFRSTPLLSHVLGLHGGPLRRWFTAVWDLDGAGVIVLLAIVVPAGVGMVIARRRGMALVITLIGALVVAYLATPGSGGGPGGDLALIAGGLRDTLPLVILAAALCSAVLPGRAWGIAAASVLVYNAAIALQAPTRSDLALSWPTAVAASATAAVLLVLAQGAVGMGRWWRTLNRWQGIAVGAPALVIAGAGVAYLLRLTEVSATTPLTTALAQAGRPMSPVVVVHDSDVRSVLGGRLDVEVSAAGMGARGRQSPIGDAAALTAQIQQLSPVAVVVGDDGVDPLPPGWRPPPAWRAAGELDRGGRIYLP